MVAVDERADPGTAAVCDELADIVHVVPGAPYVERYHGWLHAQCTSDWALRMDDDELPSDALLAALPRLLASREHSHFYLPRRWLFGGPDHHLVSEPWASDLHPRLVRTVGGLMRASGRVHREPEIEGSSSIIDAPFLHVTGLIDSHADRRQRARGYELAGSDDRLESGERVSVFYVPEDQPEAVTAPLPPGDSRRVRTFLEHAAAAPLEPSSTARPAVTVTLGEVESHLHQIPSSAGNHDARVRLSGPVPPLAAGAVRTVQVEVQNCGAGAWPAGSGGWPQVRMGSRWSHPDGTLVPDGAPRAFFTERVPPGATTRVLVPLVAPDRPGSYVLRIDVVEELVRWFDRPATQTVTVLQPPARASRPVSSGTSGEPPARSSRWPLSRRTRPRRETFARDLRLLHDVLAATPFADRYWVWGGLLLGWAREGDLLAHDLHDADFAFVTDDPAFVEASDALQAAGFEARWRFRNNHGTPTEWCFTRNEAKFEFWALQPEGERLGYYVYSDGGPDKGPPTQARASVAAQPRTGFSFLGRRWGKHEDHEQELTTLYGNWQTPDPGWWYMSDGAITAREPWYRTSREWDGSFGDPTDAPCTP